MRTLILLRGTPSSGKSTWIKNNNLEDYTLSADSIRLLYRSPVVDKNGKLNIDQSVNREAWKTLFEILEYRMSKGEFTVIDACNSKTSEMNAYKSLAEKYRYRMFCVDFTDIPIEQAKEWNKHRPELKQVSDDVIDLYYSRFKTQKIPSGIKVITRDNFWQEVGFKSVDLSNYKKVVVIGDIHGCNTALQELLKDGIQDENFYIFVGDYVDRGIENKEVIQFLLSIKDLQNVCLLEGNHEKWIWRYANDEPIQSKEFVLHTQKQLSDIDKKDLRVLYRKFRQCILFSYNGEYYFVTHAGISGFNEGDMILTATDNFINGNGNYGDIYDCQKSFFANIPYIQIHGHRNPENREILQDGNYNLEGRVEFGEFLRAVEISDDGINTIEIKNNVFNTEAFDKQEQIKETELKEDAELTIANLVTILRNKPKQIIEKKFDNISSFNFSRNVFYDKAWNDITTKARGLFINTENYTIAAKAYDKFFNINEVKETELSNLSTKLKFPVECYVKYNGFLGLLGYDEKNDKLLFCSKSNIGGEFSKYFENIFMQKFADKYNEILDFVKTTNSTIVFEVIDIENDPHIIKYTENEIVLLDIIKRELDFQKIPYDNLKQIASKFGFKVKELAYTLGSWSEFLSWYNEVNEQDYKYNGEYIEGFVIVDSNNFMTKLKGEYYRFWKFMRSVADETLRVSKNGNRQGYIKKTSALTTPEANLFYGFLRNLCETNYSGKTDIISLRDLYLKERL